MFFNTAKIMSKGQITLPVDIRKQLGLEKGDRVALIFQDNRVILMNPAHFAMETLQKEIADEWENAGINSQDDLDELLEEIRTETEDI